MILIPEDTGIQIMSMGQPDPGLTSLVSNLVEYISLRSYYISLFVNSNLLPGICILN